MRGHRAVCLATYRGGVLSGIGRRRRERRMMRRLRELDRLDAQYGLGAMPAVTRAPVTQPRRSWKAGLAMLACFGVVVAIFAGAIQRSASRDAPTIVDGKGQYSFMYTARDGETPIGWDPCTPIKVEINPAGGPPEGDQLIRTAMQHITEASGLRFEFVGTTDSRRFRDDGRGGSWSPVLVAWSNERESPDLADDIAGFGGPTVTTLNGSRRFTSGAVVLDIEAFRDVLASERVDQAQAIVDHEFGHLVGLKHVKSRDELMYAKNTGRTTWGAGDREGLERLGNIRCG